MLDPDQKSFRCLELEPEPEISVATQQAWFNPVTEFNVCFFKDQRDF